MIYISSFNTEYVRKYLKLKKLLIILILLIKEYLMYSQITIVINILKNSKKEIFSFTFFNNILKAKCRCN